MNKYRINLTDKPELLLKSRDELKKMMFDNCMEILQENKIKYDYMRDWIINVKNKVFKWDEVTFLLKLWQVCLKNYNFNPVSGFTFYEVYRAKNKNDQKGGDWLKISAVKCNLFNQDTHLNFCFKTTVENYKKILAKISK